jgi:hypothetical protein
MFYVLKYGALHLERKWCILKPSTKLNEPNVGINMYVKTTNRFHLPKKKKKTVLRFKLRNVPLTLLIYIAINSS